MKRIDGRKAGEMRPVKITPRYLKNAEGSALITVGGTSVICAATVEEKVPRFLKGKGKGWVTAEYAMLPRATHTRTPRESSTGKVGGRTHEIKRLIGRALRAVIDMEALGERTVWVDCDVLQADGGTRTASITGAFIAMALAMGQLIDRPKTRLPMLTGAVAAVSVGMVDGQPVLDLDYVEDSGAEVDMNVVRTDKGQYVELQGTAETTPFDRVAMNQMVDLADLGIERLLQVQADALGDLLPRLTGKE
jgi:ribonuclease PH